MYSSLDLEEDKNTHIDYTNKNTPIDAASKTLDKTGSIKAAKKSLRKQALFNARKLFGSV